MIYRLEVENFFSIRDHQVLDLTVAPNVPDPEGRFAPIFQGSELRAPKVVVLYGANASGKTTVLKALEFVVSLIKDSAQWKFTGFPMIERFNDRESQSRPIKLAIELGGVVNLSAEVLQRFASGQKVEFGTYRYEVSIDVVNGVATKITHEALRQRPNGQGKWQRIFERDGEKHVKDSPHFSMTGFQHLLNTLNPNVSVLSSFDFFQHPTASLFVQEARRTWFQVTSNPTTQSNDKSLIDFLSGSPEIVSNLNKEIARIDIGVEQMRFVESQNGPQAMFRHSGLEVEMPWGLESHGTRNFIKMFPGLSTVMSGGGVFAVDEFDSSIHPLLVPEIIGWFYEKSGRNPYYAQMWFSCHTASLLENLDKEEIVICQKDRKGRTSFHSLMDVKVRRDDNHYRKYMSGVYGGVPQIG